MNRIADVMTRDVRMMTPDESVTQAAQAMEALDVGAIPVCDGQRLVGMVTDRDIVLRGIAHGLPPDGTPLRAVMTRDVEYCHDDDAVGAVVERMRDRQIRRIPVIDRDDHLVGIVSLGDIAVKESDTLAGEALEEICEPARPDVR